LSSRQLLFPLRNPIGDRERCDARTGALRRLGSLPSAELETSRVAAAQCGRERGNQVVGAKRSQFGAPRRLLKRAPVSSPRRHR